MTLPSAPPYEDLDASSLTFLCSVDKVELALVRDKKTHVLATEACVDVYITANPAMPQQAIVVQCSYGEENTETIVLVSRSKAWLENETVLVFPKPDGSSFALDCRDTDPAIFKLFQDILTYFIQYENRHHMRNTLAYIDPASCEVTHVIANNVQLDYDQTSSVQENESQEWIDEEDFVKDREQAAGQKLPVMIEGADPSGETMQVKLLYRTSSAVVAGSDWVAHGLILTGQSLAHAIGRNSKKYEDQLQTPEQPWTMSDTERKIVDAVHSATSAINSRANSFLDRAISAAVAGVQSLTETSPTHDAAARASRHLGVSALQAAGRILEGAATAAGTVLTTSRDSFVHLIYKKYGQDAGYLAERAMGSTSHLAEVLVYFDARGISRRVITGSAREYSNQHQQKQQEQQQQQEMAEREVMFENHAMLEPPYTGEPSTSSAPEKPPRQIKN